MLLPGYIDKRDVFNNFFPKVLFFSIVDLDALDNPNKVLSGPNPCILWGVNGII